jgi:hypothetical protein
MISRSRALYRLAALVSLQSRFLVFLECQNRSLEKNGKNSKLLHLTEVTIAGSVANNVGLSASQLHLIQAEKCADCRFEGLGLQVATGNHCKLLKLIIDV